jgi:hypothetical protein
MGGTPENPTTRLSGLEGHLPFPYRTVKGQGGGAEKPVAAIPKSIGSHFCMHSEDCILNIPMMTRFNAQGNTIALSGLEGHLPCPYIKLP